MDLGNVIKFPKHEIGDEIPRRIEPPEGPERHVPVKAAVAGIVLLAGVVGYLTIGAHNFNAPSPSVTGSFSTAKGEHRCERAPDTSVVCLNTGTVVRYVFTGLTRHFELDSGEATFTVGPDSRPFEVGSRSLLIRDVSTQFDVYRKSGSTIVTVIDGGVKLLARAGRQSLQTASESVWNTAPVFHRPQQIEFDEATGTLLERPRLTEQGLNQFMAWQQGRIDLTDKSLSEAMQEFSRYQSIDFSFQDREMRQLHVGGLIQTTQLSDFLDSLSSVYGIHHTLTPGPDGKTVVSLTWQRNDGVRPRRK
jgi:transmembrane sensor